MAKITIAGTRCQTMISKIRGQMFRRHPKPLLLCFSHTKTIQLHTFFCFQKLDIFYLDSTYRVTSKHERVGFGQFLNGNAHYILETKTGQYPLKIGDTIRFTPDEPK